MNTIRTESQSEEISFNFSSVTKKIGHNYSSGSFEYENLGSLAQSTRVKKRSANRKLPLSRHINHVLSKKNDAEDKK